MTSVNRIVVTVVLVFASRGFAQQQPRILTNHIGYERDASKRAIVQGRAGDEVNDFKVLDARTGKDSLHGAATSVGSVSKWKDWQFWTIDLSSIHDDGTYVIECPTNRGVVRSFPFLIEPGLLEHRTLSSVIYYFKGQRCSGLLDKADSHLQFDGSPNTADVHGGWYDATGDYGKHLSHLSFSTYFNPQQIPMTDWSLFQAYELLDERNDPNFRQYKRRLLDEAMFGADYLVRVKSPDGSFYRSVDAPGGEKRAEDRRIAKEGQGFAIKTVATKDRSPVEEMEKLTGSFPFEVGYRSGGGVAIAALARASTFNVSGEFASDRYLKTARDAFDYLQKHNLQYANDGKENIVDDYCALLAATELFKATKDATHKAAADRRAQHLMNRRVTSEKFGGYWRADDGDRPFFHAVDAGMPVVSLLAYCDIADEPTKAKVLETVKSAMESEMAVTDAVSNPFGYARQLVQSKDGNRRVAFFFPHDTETAPWWQGENARLGSLATAARLTARHFKSDAKFHNQLERYAWNQLNWILGQNPFDTCMLHGAGRNNIFYMFFKSYEYTNAPGGIINGITAGLNDPEDIDFDLGFAVTGKDEDWHWGEQWLPHAAWYLYAVALGNE